ncbi:MAG TPA: sensor histidine kinase [Gaiellaceae bacterium]
MSTREDTRGLPARPAPSSARRADLEAVWAIGASDGAAAAVDAVVGYAARTLAEAAFGGDDDARASARSTIPLVVELTGLDDDASRRILFHHSVRTAALTARDPRATVEAALRLLGALSPVTAASVWTRTSAGRVDAIAAWGALPATRGCKRAAAALLERREPVPVTSRARVHSFPLGDGDGALVVRVAPDAYLETLPFLDDLAGTFPALAERDRLAHAVAADEKPLQRVYERRLTRAAFDLHDGPLQDLAALAGEVRLLRAQVLEHESLPRDVVAGRLDDVSARVLELDETLRSVMHSLETSTLAERPLPEALQREADTFMRRSDGIVEVEVSGSFDDLTASQRIAVVRIVQEALSNIREHSGATRVRVVLDATPRGLALRVEDDGRGFDVTETAAAAARRGRMGLVGMGERVRLLGGVFSIESAPGAGATVLASIPAWRPNGASS